LIHSMRLSLMKGAHADLSSAAWVGRGTPSFSTKGFTRPVVYEIQQYMHTTTNLLVDSRVSLFVIYPGLKIGYFVNLTGRPPMSISAADAQANTNNDHPFAGDVNFGVFVNQTGGKLFYNRNDVDAEMERSQQLGSEYYTLTYQPRDGDPNGKFRQIRVTLRDHNLRAVTKTGYYAPDKSAPIDPRRQTNVNLAEAARTTIPFAALDLKVAGIVRPGEPHGGPYLASAIERHRLAGNRQRKEQRRHHRRRSKRNR
jgi:hypothetical protein